VVVDPAGYRISAGEVELSFNPQVLEAIDIQAGALLGSDVILGARQIDNVGGKLRIAVAKVGSIPGTAPPTAQGVLATTQWKVREGVAAQQVSITISFVGLADRSFQDVPGITVSSGTVKVQ
jgi:hypothetical protein